MRRMLAALCVLCCAAVPLAQRQPESPKDYIREQGPIIALEHVRVIDGTGGPAKADQTIVISGGKIAAIGAAGTVQ
ncbi:MAG TPA: amidohydrolase, partial [Candidatus Angelobacter sp.]|nr:amidohydrolase [Candidatus Angelobacter sp.]